MKNKKGGKVRKFNFFWVFKDFLRTFTGQSEICTDCLGFVFTELAPQLRFTEHPVQSILNEIDGFFVTNQGSIFFSFLISLKSEFFLLYLLLAFSGLFKDRKCIQSWFYDYYV